MVLSLDKMRINELGFRHFQVVMLCIAMMMMFSVHVNMSIAVISMTDATQDNGFNWTYKTQGVILSSFQWGYIVLKIPGGELTARCGGWLMLTAAIAVNSIVCLIIPTAANWGGWMAVCACRLVQGLASGVVFPAMHYLIGKWAPLDEKSRLGAVIYGSGQLGTALQLVTGGVIASTWGWPGVFYATGLIGIAWTIVFFIFGASSPHTSKYISHQERVYIEKSLGQTGEIKKARTPWGSLLTCLPLYALIVVTTGETWGYWTLLTEIPTYMKHILGFDTRANGMVSSVPYFASFATSFVFGAIADHLISNRKLTLTTCRKIFSCTCTMGPALVLIALSFASTNVAISVALLTVGNMLQSAFYSSANLVHLDLAPRHAATLVGITSFVANSAALMAPLAAGLIIQDETSPSEWRKVFFLSAGIMVTSAVVFLLFGSSKRQKWNDTELLENNSQDSPNKSIGLQDR